MDMSLSNKADRKLKRKSMLADPSIDDPYPFPPLSYPTTKFIPYQDQIVHFLVTFTLFNGYIFRIFLKHGSYGGIRSAGQSILRQSDFDVDWADGSRREPYPSRYKNSTHEVMHNMMIKYSKSSRSFRNFCIFVVTAQGTLLLKDLLIMMLKYLPDHSPYRIIDCYLLGRTLLTGTYTQVSQRIDLVFCGLHLAFSLYNIFCVPNARLTCLEFLLHTCEQVEAVELELPETRPSLLLDSIDQDDSCSNDMAFSSQRQEIVRCSIFHYSEPVLKTVSQLDPEAKTHCIKIRKNRNLICWSKLMRTTLKFFSVCLIISVITSIPIAYCIMSVLLTRQGFELNYSTCVNYIKSLNHDERQRFEFIYIPDDKNVSKPIGVILDLSDTIPFDSPYNVARMLADGFQTTVAMTVVSLSFVSHTYLAVLVISDLENYLDSIEHELSRLVQELRRVKKTRMKTQLRSMLDKGQAFAGELVPGDTKWSRLHLSKQISSVQAQLMDMWTLIAQYSVYVQNLTLVVILSWILYSVTAAEYLIAPDGIIYYETIGGQLATTVYFLTVVGQYAIITRRIRRLYPLMASAMALDDDCVDSKSRWPIMLAHFHPKPIYSFKVSQFTISWNFCLQLMSWITTGGLIVGSNINFRDQIDRRGLI